MIGMIAACTSTGVIGANGKIPWRYKGDFARFKRVTMGAAVIMGRKTFESMGSKPLPGRTNIVLTSGHHVSLLAMKPVVYQSTNGVHGAIQSALHDDPNRDVWLIGGERVYTDGLAYADIIDLTWVPDEIDMMPGAEMARFPIEEVTPANGWCSGGRQVHPDEPALKYEQFRRESSR